MFFFCCFCFFFKFSFDVLLNNLKMKRINLTCSYFLISFSYFLFLFCFISLFLLPQSTESCDLVTTGSDAGIFIYQKSVSSISNWTPRPVLFLVGGVVKILGYFILVLGILCLTTFFSVLICYP